MNYLQFKTQFRWCIVMLQVGFKVYRVEEEVEELKTDFFAYARNDGLHRSVSVTRLLSTCDLVI